MLFTPSLHHLLPTLLINLPNQSTTSFPIAVETYLFKKACTLMLEGICEKIWYSKDQVVNV